jgi:hypothetical protein
MPINVTNNILGSAKCFIELLHKLELQREQCSALTIFEHGLSRLLWRPHDRVMYSIFLTKYVCVCERERKLIEKKIIWEQNDIICEKLNCLARFSCTPEMHWANYCRLSLGIPKYIFLYFYIYLNHMIKEKRRQKSPLFAFAPRLCNFHLQMSCTDNISERNLWWDTKLYYNRHMHVSHTTFSLTKCKKWCKQSESQKFSHISHAAHPNKF